jgi:large subunit ribosomal protein L31e
MERTYTIPLRKEFQKAPRYKKTSKAVRATKEFLKKHMKAEDIKLGKYLNELLWKNGPKNPPHKVKIIAKKEDNVVKAELVGAPEEVKKEVKKKRGKGLKGLTEKLKEKPSEEKKEKPKEEKKEEAKLEKKEIKKAEPKKEEKIPTASELTEQYERKAKAKKVPTSTELKEKTSKK